MLSCICPFSSSCCTVQKLLFPKCSAVINVVTVSSLKVLHTPQGGTSMHEPANGTPHACTKVSGSEFHELCIADQKINRSRTIAELSCAFHELAYAQVTSFVHAVASDVSLGPGTC